jgi:putative tricarboxylic transport membrane protein
MQTPEPGDAGAEDTSPTFSSRWPELLLSVGLMLVAAIVLMDAKRLGTGWDEFDGPRAGYFPFYVGCLLMAAAAWIFLRQLYAWRSANPEFASRQQMGRVWAVVWPTGAFILLIGVLGIYFAAAVLISWFMRRHGSHGWASTAGVAIGVPLFFFVVFERYFLVALPKGPIESLLGF